MERGVVELVDTESLMPQEAPAAEGGQGGRFGKDL